MQKLEQEFTKVFNQRQIELQHQQWLTQEKDNYDLFPEQYEFEWKSECIQWLPFRDEPQQSEFSYQKLLFGTNTKDNDNKYQDTNYLQIGKFKIPLLYNREVIDNDKFLFSQLLRNESTNLSEIEINNQENDEGGMMKQNEDDAEEFKSIEIDQRIVHDGEVVNARYMPQKPNFIATKTIKGEVLIFDYNLHPKEPKVKNQCIPQLKLKGHNQSGKGLCWNPNQVGMIASGGFDNKICIWEIEKASRLSQNIEPHFENKFHKSKVNDVCWHKKNESLLCSVSSDKQFALWDLKSQNKGPTHFSQGHNSDILSADFSPFNDFLFLTSSSDRTIALWDMRNATKRIQVLQGHNDVINKVQWLECKEGLVVSCSKDRQILVWDLNKQKEMELVYQHKGHSNEILDFDSNKNEQDKFLISSVDKNKVLQIWKMKEPFNEQ